MLSNNYITINHVKELMTKGYINIDDIWKKTGIPKETLKTVINQQKYNLSLNSALLISRALHAPINEVFEQKINTDLLFNEHNLESINKMNTKLNIKLNFDIYNYTCGLNGCMNSNVSTYYWGNRRLYFSGNFAINPEYATLYLRDFDIMQNRKNVPDFEKSNLYIGILKSIQYYSKYTLRNRFIKLRLGTYNLNLKDCSRYTSPEQFSSRLDISDKNQYDLFLHYRDAFSCGFRLSDEELKYRDDYGDIWMYKKLK